MLEGSCAEAKYLESQFPLASGEIDPRSEEIYMYIDIYIYIHMWRRRPGTFVEESKGGEVCRVATCTRPGLWVEHSAPRIMC